MAYLLPPQRYPSYEQVEGFLLENKTLLSLNEGRVADVANAWVNNRERFYREGNRQEYTLDMRVVIYYCPKNGGYLEGKEIGRGGDKKVYAAALLDKLKLVAMPYVYGVDSYMKYWMSREVNALQSFHNLPGIVKIVGEPIVKEPKPNSFEICFFEQKGIGTLGGKVCLTLKERLCIFRDACIGVQKLHEAGAIVVDFKPKNIIYDRKKRGMLIDLGSVGVKGENTRDFSHSPLYASPKQMAIFLGLTNEVFDYSDDIWSIGMSLIEVFKNNLLEDEILLPLFENVRVGNISIGVFTQALHEEVMKQVVGVTPHIYMIVESCLDLNPSHRPTIEEVVTSLNNFITNLD